jgi:PAS domain-containing protein
MTFSDITIRLKQLGLDRKWLAEQCHYSLSHVSNALAPKGNESSKSETTLKRMWEALDREEERQRDAIRIPPALRQRVVIEPTDEQFDRWMRAAYSVPGRTFDTWAKAGLEELAERELPRLLAERSKSPVPPNLVMTEAPVTEESNGTSA